MATRISRTKYAVALAIAAALFFQSGGQLFAQGPVGDRLHVTVDREARVGGAVLSPGDYTIRQINTASNPDVLEFSTDRGTKVAATVTAIPMLQNTPPSSTKVVFDNEGGVARITKIYVQGKEYGYEFTKDISRNNVSTALTMQVRYDAPTVTSSANPSTTNVANRNETATASLPATSGVAANPTRETAVNTPNPSQNTNTSTNSATPTVASEPSRSTDSTLLAQQSTPQSPVTNSQNSANSPAATAPQSNAISDQTPSLPATGLGWGNLVGLGVIMTAGGMLLRRHSTAS